MRIKLTQEEVEFLRNILIQVSKEAEDGREFDMLYQIVGKLNDDAREIEKARRRQMRREVAFPNSCFCKEPDVDYGEYPGVEFDTCKKCGKSRYLGPAMAGIKAK